MLTNSRLIKLFYFSTALIVGAIVLTVVFQPSPPQASQKAKTWPVKSISLVNGDHRPTLILHGRVTSLHEATLRASQQAYVKHTLAQEGNRLKEGALIVMLDPTDALLIYQQRHAELLQLNAELNQEVTRNEYNRIALGQEKDLISLLNKSVSRQTELAKDSLSSQSNIEVAKQASVRETISQTARELELKNYEGRFAALQAKIIRAQSLEQQAQLEVDRTKILAPFPAIVSELNVAIGDRVQMGSLIATIYDYTQLEIKAELPTRYIEAFDKDHADAIITAQLFDMNDKTVLTFKRLAGRIDESQAGINAFFSVLGYSEQIRFGQAVKILVQLPPADNSYIIPHNALYEIVDQKIVYEIVENEDLPNPVLKAHDVQIVGEQYKNQTKYVIISSPSLQNGTKLLATRLPNAHSGLNVELRGD